MRNYPRSYFIKNISDISKILKQGSLNNDLNGLNSWVSKNAGPIPFEKMPDRVVHIIEQMIYEKSKDSLTEI